MMDGLACALEEVGRRRGIGGGGKSYESLFDPSNPPRPIEIAPANSSASPPETTTFAFLYSVRPAATANGTTMPSETPMTASLILLGPGLKLRRRWSSDNCWGEWELGAGGDEVVVGACGARV